MYASWYRSVDRRFANIISRGNLNKPLDDSQEVQNAEITTYPGQDYRGVLRSQQYGFTSRPGAGAEIVLICEDGEREGSIVISADHPDLRPRIEDYEACVWTKFGSHVYLTKDNEVDVKGKKFIMTVNTDAVINSPKFAVKSQTDELVKCIYDALLTIKTVSDTLSSGSGPMPFSAMTAFSTAISPVLTRLNKFIVS